MLILGACWIPWRRLLSLEGPWQALLGHPKGSVLHWCLSLPSSPHFPWSAVPTSTHDSNLQCPEAGDKGTRRALPSPVIPWECSARRENWEKSTWLHSTVTCQLPLAVVWPLVIPNGGFWDPWRVAGCGEGAVNEQLFKPPNQNDPWPES